MESLLKDKALECIGCLNCYNICKHKAISLQTNSDGTIYPMINKEYCIDCKQCESVCPILTQNKKNHPISIYAGWSKRYRKGSTSGGIFSEIAQFVLEHNGIVYGASMTDSCICNHIRVSDISQLAMLRGSKYVESNLHNSFSQIKDDLRENKIVLFSGTPCQVDALRSFLKNNKKDNLITIDILCKGVPVQNVFNSYINKLSSELHIGRPTKYQFRQLNSWRYANDIYIMKDVFTIPVEKRTYIEAFTKSLIFKECCYVCKYKSIEKIQTFNQQRRFIGYDKYD